MPEPISRVGLGVILCVGVLVGVIMFNGPVGAPEFIPGDVVGCSNNDKWVENSMECRVALHDGSEQRFPLLASAKPGTRVYVRRYQRRLFGYAYAL